MKAIDREYLLKRCDQQSPGGCWLWTGRLTRTGYGNATRRNVAAHRASYTVFVGPIPDGLCVLHKCDVRRCINPDHLFAGTQKENMHDAMRKGRLKPPPVHRKAHRGEKNPRAKLKQGDVDEIRRNELRLSYRKLAEKYGVSKSLVRFILIGKRWAN